MAINDVTGAVVDAALKVHSVLGPGLLESAYQACLAYELRKRGLTSSWVISGLGCSSTSTRRV